MLPTSLLLSVGKEIKYITQLRTRCAIHLSKGAILTADGGKALVLHIKNLRKHPAGSAKLIYFIFPVIAFRALPVFVSHGVILH